MSHWDFIYKIAVDIPQTPGEKTTRTYYEFFKSLMTVLPDRDERLAYRKLTKDGPFKLTSSIFAGGPQKTLEWVVDIRNGILLTLGKPTVDDATTLWKTLKYSRSIRNALNNVGNDENLALTKITSTAHFEKHINSGRLTLVMFDKMHFLLLFPRHAIEGAADAVQIKARFGIDAAIVPGRLSYKWFFSRPFTGARVSKFPWFRLYKDGKMILESKDAEDIKRYLKQRAMRNAPVTFVSQNNNRRRTPRTTTNGVAYGLGQGIGRNIGRSVVKRAAGLVF
jgi:hypothetical protein